VTIERVSPVKIQKSPPHCANANAAAGSTADVRYDVIVCAFC
jgi:hypothetical protein